MGFEEESLIIRSKIGAGIGDRDGPHLQRIDYRDEDAAEGVVKLSVVVEVLLIGCFDVEVFLIPEIPWVFGDQAPDVVSDLEVHHIVDELQLPGVFGQFHIHKIAVLKLVNNGIGSIRANYRAGRQRNGCATGKPL